MRILLFLILLNPVIYGALSSVNYDLNFEGDSSGRISGVSSSNYYISGDTGSFSGGFSSAHYEINNGWYYTIEIDITPPPTVVSPAAETLANGNIKINWGTVIDNESFIRGYRIYRSVKQSTDGILLTEADGNEFTDTSGLIYGITYYYRVKPVDLGANESITGNISVSGFSKSLCSSIDTLAAVSRPAGKVELSWKSLPGLSYYRIYRSEIFGEKGTQVNADGSTVAGVFSQLLSDGLTDGKRYYYTAQGVDDSANEQHIGNNQATAVCDAVPPTVPVVSSATHPDVLPNVDNCPRFSWIEAEDPKAPGDGGCGVKGYYYLLSRSASESFSSTWIFKNCLTVSYDKIADGEWYLYVLAEDNAGNKSTAASKKIVIVTTGEITGKVCDFDGKTPLKDTRLELIAGRSVLKSARTDSEGNYRFTCVPFGEYKIKIFKAGFNPFETEAVSLSKSCKNITMNKTVETIQNIGAEGIATYPNPCRTGSVTFVYKVDAPGKAVITVFNAAGEKLAFLEENQNLTGFRETRWDASLVPTGVYFYSVKLENKGNTIRFPVKKLSIIR